MPVITNIKDLRWLARRRFPQVLSNYVDRGSYDETNVRANSDEMS